MKAKQISMLIAALLLGVLVSVQWPTTAAQRFHTPNQIEQTIQQLELEQQELKRVISDLRRELDERQQHAAGKTLMLQEIQAELLLQKAYAGLTGVRGAGVQVILDDGPSTTGSGEANNALVHDYDLRDVINILWMAGAEAIAVNGERIVNNSSIYCVGATVLVNDTRLSPPYQINAIGDVVRLQDFLHNPGYLRKIKTRADRFGLRLEFIRVESMTIPAYRGSIPQSFAQPGSQ